MKTIFLIFALIAVALGNQNLLHQEQIITKVNQIQKNWVSGYNKYFDGKSIQEIKILMGALKVPKERDLPFKKDDKLQLLTATIIPTEFFSATQWPLCESIREIRDQSNCGSCWAFGAVEAMSDRICIASGQTLQTRISSEDLLTCCGNFCGRGCGGGYISAAWNYFKNTGIVTGCLYGDKTYCQPYFLPPCNSTNSGTPQCSSNQRAPKCQKSCVNGASYIPDKWFASSVYKVPSIVTSIQTEIMTNGPVEAGFTVYSDFMTYRSGVYHHVSGGVLGGHAIKIVGWGVENTIPYWLAANSWNTDWGENGFFKILRGSNQCGIEGQIYAGIPRLKTP